MANLTVNARYRVVHQRKGTFEATFLGAKPTDEGDPQDREFWEMAIDTSEGSGAEWLRRAAGALVTISHIRPSLVIEAEETSNG